MAGTEDADTIAEFLLSHFDLVELSTKLYAYDIRGISGHLALRVDRNGLIVFALYPKKPGATRLKFKRDKGKYRYAQRPIFFTAPEIWAHLNGYAGLHLKPDEYREWKLRLEAAAEIVEEELRFKLPRFPWPGDADEDGWHEEKWAEFEAILKKRLARPYRWKMHWVYVFFGQRWIDTSKKTWTGMPCCIKASDGYIAENIGTSRHAIRRIILDLDRLGCIQAAIYEPSGEKNKKGIYSYLPGMGIPPKTPTRHPRITKRETLTCMREFIRRNVADWRKEFLKAQRAAIEDYEDG